MTRLRIVVTGLAATFALGGVFWDYLQYALGLEQLGHEVLYLEDSGRWCYQPEANTYVEDGAHGAAWLGRAIGRLDTTLADHWFFRDCTGQTYGLAWPRVIEFCASADLFLHISAACVMRDEYRRARRLAFIDSDPMYTQAVIAAHVNGVATLAERRQAEALRVHDVFFTFGENIGSPECAIPQLWFNWLPTRQPLALQHVAPASVCVPRAARRRVLTTVMSWEPAEQGPLIDGVHYTGKSTELTRFIDLPARSALPLEVAMSGKAPYDRLREQGWRVRDALEVSHDPWVYRDYLANSLGEWSVAKNAYVASRSGWFSCRSACYLALGVPVIVQDTGFSRILPCGEGLLGFDTAEEAVAAIDDLAARPARHAAAAREIAHEYFSAERVLNRLLEQALGTPAPDRG